MERTMKRTLAVALSTLALAASGVQAQSLSLPQPSFIDHVPLVAEEQDASRGATTAATTTRQDMPQPSFVDYVPIEAYTASAGGSAMRMARHRFPAPSFVDYPDVGATDPLERRLEYVEAGTR